MTDVAAPPHTAPPLQRGARAVAEFVVIVVVALAVTTLVRLFLVQAFYIPSPSMVPTLQVDDRVLVSTRTAGDVGRGDVVVFLDPGGWLPPAPVDAGATAWLRSALRTVGLLPQDSGEHLVKRVIGTGGDHVVCCDPKGRITVNGQALVEPYIAPGAGTAQVPFDIRVPAGRYFVMGDNRGDSEDSRFHLETAAGTVPAAAITGPVIAVVWPTSRWQRVDDVSATFARVPAPTPARSAPMAEAVP